jgi:hypothetical protein
MISEMQEMQLRSTVGVRDSADDTESGRGKCIQGTRPKKKRKKEVKIGQLVSQVKKKSQV